MTDQHTSSIGIAVSCCCFWLAVTSATITRTQCELAVDDCNQEQCEEALVFIVSFFIATFQ